MSRIGLAVEYPGLIVEQLGRRRLSRIHDLFIVPLAIGLSLGIDINEMSTTNPSSNWEICLQI